MAKSTTQPEPAEDDDARRARLAAGHADSAPHRKRIDERIAELGLKKVDIAAALMVHPNIVHKMLNGERRLQVPELRYWAKVLQLPFSAAVQKFGFEVPGARVPLIGAVDGRGRVRLYTPDRCKEIAAPDAAGGGLVALEVDSAHSALSVYHGSIIYYQPSATVNISAFGRLAVLEIDGEPAPVLGVLDRASMGRGSVVVFGGAETLQTETLISAAPVHWQRFG